MTQLRTYNSWEDPMPRLCALAIAALYLAAAPTALAAPALSTPMPEATARPGDLTVWVQFVGEENAPLKRLAALGFRLRSELRVMRKVNGHRVCDAVFEGFLPREALGAARAVNGVKEMGPRP
jgi:hypothetical protein